MTLLVTRRRAAGLVAALAASPILGTALGPVRAQELNVRRGGNFEPIPIAVTRFVGDGADGDKVSSIVLNDFKRSVFLTPVGGVQDVGNPDQAPAMDAFRNLNAHP